MWIAALCPIPTVPSFAYLPFLFKSQRGNKLEADFTETEEMLTTAMGAKPFSKLQKGKNMSDNVG